MAVENLKSLAITNRDSSPKVLSNANVIKGTLMEACGKVEAAAASSSASKYYFCQVPSNARISQILLSCDSSGTAGAMDIGVYKSTADGGTVVDVDFFASAQSVASALINSDVTHEADAADGAAGYGRSDVEKPLWQALGLSADPGITYDIVGTVTTALVDATTIGLKVKYVI